ncbi:hypothetical protein CsSME_00004971 [Camellia sinensis var. sinensis]
MILILYDIFHVLCLFRPKRNLEHQFQEDLFL